MDEITIDFELHLDSQHIPDPARITDYIIIVLGALFVCIVISFNIILGYLSSRWLPVVTKNVPLVYLMSFASIVHIISVFLNESFFFNVTQKIQGISCVFFYFWLEYFFGLGSFLCVLGLRLLTILFIVVPEMKPNGGENRKFALKLFFVTIFMLPIFNICLLVTVNKADVYTLPEDYVSEGIFYGYCETPNRYKIPLVLVLICYILLLVGMAFLCKNAHDLQQTPIIIDIVKVSIPLLVLASFLHFTYTLTYWWGRFVFMLLVMTLHMFSYGRIVFNNLINYLYQNDVQYSKNMELALKNIRKDINTESTNIDVPTLQRYEKIRESFFEHCISFSDGKLYDYKNKDLIDAIHDDENIGIPITRLIDFYRELNSLNAALNELLKLDPEIQYSIFRPKKIRFDENHSRLIKRFIDIEKTKPIPISDKARNSLVHGFSSDDKEDWNVDIINTLLREILSILIIEFSLGYYVSMDTEILKMKEEQISELSGVTAEDVYSSWYQEMEEPEEAITSVIIHTLTSGPSERTLYFENQGVVEESTESEKILQRDFNNLTVEECQKLALQIAMEKDAAQIPKKPIHLTDGSIIYTSPIRALIAFFRDIGIFIVTCPVQIKDQYDQYNREVMEEVNFTEERSAFL